MAPEQARGEAVEARADVFALGATLAAILTGRPAFVGASAREVIDRAARADLADVRERLQSSAADGELIALALRCLSARAKDRPADGRAVASEVAAYRARVEARLKQAETERAEALVREAEQRKRRRTVQVAGCLLAVVLLAGLSVSLWQMFRAIAAEGEANANATQATLNAEEAERNANEVRQERDAKDAALKAETRAREQAFAALRSMTDVFEKRFAQTLVLNDDDREFLRGVIAQFDAFAVVKGDDADGRAVRAEGRVRVGNLRSKLGELKEAEHDYDQAVSLCRQLVADFPSRPGFRSSSASSHRNRGLLLQTTGRAQEAERDYDQAVSLCQRLVADFPSRPEFRHELAQSHNGRGNLLIATGRPREAEQEFDQALSIRKQLVADFPTRLDFRQELATSHNNRGLLLRTTGRAEEAEHDHDQAVSIYQQLVADFPSRPEFRHELAQTHNNRGNLLYTTGRLKEAEQDYAAALSLRRQLAADFPSRPDFRQELAASHNNRGILLITTGRPQEAEHDFDQALSLRKQLAADFPTQPDRRNDVAATCVNLALLQEQQGNHAEAQRLLLEGRPHHLAALKANPRHPTYRQFYRNHLRALTTTHAFLLEQADAVRTAETRRDLGWDAPADAYDAACSLSRCVSIVAQHDKLDDKQRKEAAQFYGDAAMKLLREAVRMGYQDVPHLKKDAALAPLRPREDFQQLVAELEGKGN
jgi:tetratricopeptide (TPR) repeat protein